MKFAHLLCLLFLISCEKVEIESDNSSSTSPTINPASVDDVVSVSGWERAGERIPLEKAKQMIQAYQQSNREGLHSVYYSIETFKRLMQVPGIVGVSVYYGLDENGKLHPIFVPVNSDRNNIYSSADGGSVVEEFGAQCPPFCPSNANILIK